MPPDNQFGLGNADFSVRFRDSSNVAVEGGCEVSQNVHLDEQSPDEKGSAHHGNQATGAVNAAAVLSLLDTADVYLTRDIPHARRCIGEALALLRAESDNQGERNLAGRGTLAPQQIRSVARFVDENLSGSIGVDDLAAIAGLSTSHFSRVFHRTVGESPFGYVRRRRVERAQQLMLLTDQSLAAIALECGLADQPHLTRTFRRIVGLSPGVWRRLRRPLQRSVHVDPQ